MEAALLPGATLNTVHRPKWFRGTLLLALVGLKIGLAVSLAQRAGHAFCGRHDLDPPWRCSSSSRYLLPWRSHWLCQRSAACIERVATCDLVRNRHLSPRVER